MTLNEDRAPLLGSEAEPETSSKPYREDGPPSEDRSASARRFWPEGRRVLSLAVPISLSEVVSYGAYLITTAQVGHLGPLDLPALTLARSVFHITGLSLVVGMASAVDTFCGQAFGAARHRVLGLVLQRAVLLSLLTCVLPLALWTNAEWLMLRIGQQRAVVTLAAAYVRLLSPALCLWAVGGCIKNYLSSQGVVTPLTVVSVIYTALTPLVNHLFIFHLGMGMTGAAIAYNVLQAFEMVLLVGAMAWLHRCQKPSGAQTWGGFSSQAFKGWGEYLKIALPSTAAICLDWWTYEAVVLVAGMLPNGEVQLGAMGLAFNTHALLFMVVGGFSSAACTRVSNELGAGRGRGACYAALVSLGFGMAAPLAASAGLLAAPRAWARLYTPVAEVVDLVAGLMPLLTLSNLADSVASVSSGVLRGSGRQELAFMINLGTYWFIGLPLAALLALKFRMGVWGLWIAMTTASVQQAFILVVSFLRFDWPEEARKAMRRVIESHGAAEEAAEAEASDVAVAVAEAGPAEEAAQQQRMEEGSDAGTRPVAAAGTAGLAAVNGGFHGLRLPHGVDNRHGVYEPLLTSEHAN